MRTRSTGRNAKQKAEAVAGKAETPPSKPATSAKGSTLGDEILVDHNGNVVSPSPIQASNKGVGSDSKRRTGAVKMEGFETIIDNVFTFDPDKAFEEVKGFLESGTRPSRAEYGDLVDALDKAGEIATLAHQLVANARVSYARQTIDIAVLAASLRDQAVQELAERSDKKPTIADIDAYMTSTYYDVVMDHKEQLAKGKETCEYLEGMTRAIEQRGRDLRQMVASARGN